MKYLEHRPFGSLMLEIAARQVQPGASNVILTMVSCGHKIVIHINEYNKYVSIKIFYTKEYNRTKQCIKPSVRRYKYLIYQNHKSTKGVTIRPYRKKIITNCKL